MIIAQPKLSYILFQHNNHTFGQKAITPRDLLYREVGFDRVVSPKLIIEGGAGEGGGRGQQRITFGNINQHDQCHSFYASNISHHVLDEKGGQ